MSMIRTHDSRDREWKIHFTWHSGYPEKCINGTWFPKDPDDIVFDYFEVLLHGRWFEMPQRIAEKYINLDDLDFDDVD